MQTVSNPLWGIILAGGDGQRLQAFIRARCGEERPKQYCTFLGKKSMLRQTVSRVERLIVPERLQVVTLSQEGTLYGMSHWH
ncbi:MAG: hypothetical protein FJZ47_04240 [Candidatus Tectomicrobia bacterium]|uniref:Uncharacterized protein n=1 Tax=Tectimicrobiota bacterium TaxID=2528274 RepID=A0A937W029_UNCTE|nr:hypothetical protein [Candidatus Tectomicrobia bacterium]